MSLDGYDNYLSGIYDDDQAKYREIDSLTYSLTDTELSRELLVLHSKNVEEVRFKVDYSGEKLKKFQLKQKEEIKKNNETKQIDEKRLFEYETAKTDLESELISISGRLCSLIAKKKIIEDNMQTISKCHYCSIHSDDKHSAFMKLMRDNIKDYEIEIKSAKIDFYRDFLKWESIKNLININKKIKIQHNYTQKCKEFLESSRTLAQLKRFLSDVFDYGAEKPTMVKSMIRLPSREGIVASIDQNGKIYFNNFATIKIEESIFNIFEDIDCVGNPFRLKFMSQN